MLNIDDKIGTKITVLTLLFDLYYMCKVAYLHIHDVSLKLIFGEKSETTQIISIFIMGNSASDFLEMMMPIS